MGKGEHLDLPADPSMADEPEHESVEAAAEHQIRRPDPVLAAPDQAVSLGHPPQEREDERDRQLRGRSREHPRRVRHGHTPPAAGLEVDVVHADRVVGDDAQLRARRVEQLVVDPVGEHQHQPVLAGDALQELLALERPHRVVQVDLERALELRPHAIGKAAGREDARHHLAFDDLGVRSWAASSAASASAAHSRVFHAGTGVRHSSRGTKRERSTSWYSWM